METHAAAAKEAHCMKTAIASIAFLIVVQWRVKLTPGAKNVVNASKLVWTKMETPSVRAKDGQQPNSAIIIIQAQMHSSQTAVQKCRQAPGVINVANVGRLNC